MDERLYQVLELTNAYRAEQGLAPLRLNLELSKAAQDYAERMAAESFFDHNSPDGDSPGDRITWAGYQWMTWGENIAVGYRTPVEVMKAWIKSPSHRQNLVNPNYSEIGLGFAVGYSLSYGPGAVYWSQEFAMPKK